MNRLVRLFATGTMCLMCATPIVADAAARDVRKRQYPVPEGLTPIAVRSFHHAFVRKEANLAAYRRVLISTGEFAFDPKWRPERVRRPLRADTRQRIREKFLAAVHEDFAKAFDNQGGYTVADAPAADVLRIVVHINDVYLNAPDEFDATVQRNYATSIGSMGLKIQVFDPSGSILLAEAHAYRTDPEEHFGLFWQRDSLERLRVTELDNIEFARRAARDFAEALRVRILAAH
ncbi:MAG: hypothetical protein NZM12_07560 [Steroidobacteraceae bacterium]|nr:hypothetical protein [Steroidobacteraceae bacterium]MDW8259180.1 hypothetical protein [Gammaproteobacteria bacterium]